MLEGNGINNVNLPFLVVATSLFAGSFASVSGFIKHLSHRNVLLRKGLLLGLGSFISSFLGPQIITKLDPSLPRIFISLILIILVIKMNFGDKIIRGFRIELHQKYLFWFGILLGFIASITGLGGGVFYVPLLYYLFNAEMHKAIGTSLLAVSLTMLSSAMSYLLINQSESFVQWQIGYVYLLAGIPLGIGSLMGAVVGSSISFKCPEVLLKRIFSLFLAIVVIKLIFLT